MMLGRAWSRERQEDETGGGRGSRPGWGKPHPAGRGWAGGSVPGAQAVGVLSIQLHLAGSGLPEAGKVAKVPTGPEIVLRLLSQSHPATGQGGPAGALSHSQIGLCTLVSQDCPLSSGGTQALLLLGPLPEAPSACGSGAASMKPTHCRLL